LVSEIKKGLEEEGLGDLAGKITSDETGIDTGGLKEHFTNYRQGFKQFEGKIYLPKFVIQEKENWRDIMFEADILADIDWGKMNIDDIEKLELQNQRSKEQVIVLGLSDEEQELLKETGRLEKTGTLEIDLSFFARQIGDLIPNPWYAYEIAGKAVMILQQKYNHETIAANFVFIIEELKKILDKERNRLSEQVFRQKITDKKLCFFLITDQGGFTIPSRIKVRSNKQLIRNDNTPIQKSLFDYVPEEDYNDLEKSVAIYLDEQEKLLWWYRNISRQDYHIQEWKRSKIYPDFLSADTQDDSNDYGTVYVLETKGIHLKNEDTKYKQDVFTLCNELGAKKAWKELFSEFSEHHFEFQVVFGNEWENKINRMFR
jgi:type III restriction enzyme